MQSVFKVRKTEVENEKVGLYSCWNHSGISRTGDLHCHLRCRSGSISDWGLLMIRSGLSLTSGLVLGFIVGLTVSATLILLRDFDDSELINQLQTEGANR
jgi:hypothetical protein